MNTNLVADTIYTYLSTKHARVYRNAPPSTVTFPYVVFNCENVEDTHPSQDYYLYIDIFDSPSASVRVMETLADTIDTGLNMVILDSSTINIHCLRSLRQFLESSTLTNAKQINLQYSARTYFK